MKVHKLEKHLYNITFKLAENDQLFYTYCFILLSIYLKHLILIFYISKLFA